MSLTTPPWYHEKINLSNKKMKLDFCILIDGGRRTIESSAYGVYEYLSTLPFVDEFEAIEASSWCELASESERYFGNGFDIVVVERF